MVLLGVCDVIQDGGHLGFYPKLEIIQKMAEIKIFYARRVKCDIIKHFAAFGNIYFFT